jgi:hypothetical protein
LTAKSRVKELDAIREYAERGEASNPLCSSMSDGVTSVIDAGSLHHFIRRTQRTVALRSSGGLENGIPKSLVAG